MKKISFSLISLILGLLMLAVLPSCDKDENEDPTAAYKPVINKNFSFTVDGNNVNFATTMAGNVWFSSNGVDYQTVDKKVTVKLPLKGTYSFTCSSLGSGSTLTSDAFEVAIAADDLSFLETGLWKDLTGGSAGGKHWVLDSQKVYFHNPLDFYGDADAGGAADNVWGPWGGTSLYDWGSSPENGFITFNGVTGVATLTLDGVAKTGTFNLTVYDRAADFLTLTDGKSLWENMITGKYSKLGTLSTQMADLVMTGDVRFPLDRSRMAENQFLVPDLQNVKLMHVSDSALVLRVKRSFEGADQHASTCWLLYNFICKEYNYPLPQALSQPVKTDFTAANLVGTWKYDANVPFDWIGWAGAKRLNSFTNHAEIVATGWAATQEQLDAAADDVFVFNNDGTCTLNGVANTYTYAQGKITFGTDLTTELGINFIALTGKEIFVIDVKKNNDDTDHTYNGVWLGQQNEGKDESKTVHLVKQKK